MKEKLNIQMKTQKREHIKKKIYFLTLGIISIITGVTLFGILKLDGLADSNPQYQLKLHDIVEKTWTTGENLDLELIYVDNNDNIITEEIAKDLNPILEIDIVSNPDNYYAFGKEPSETNNQIGTNITRDVIKLNNLQTISYKNGGKSNFYKAYYRNNDSDPWEEITRMWCNYSSSGVAPTNIIGYGWYFNNNVKITENTKIKFKYKTEIYDSSSNYTIPSVGLDSGIKVKLFDYDSTSFYNGVNSNGLYPYFTFRDADKNLNIEYNQVATDADGFINLQEGERRAKVEKTLTDGYPVFDCGGVSGCTNKSLGYLFGAGGNGVTNYDPINTLLIKETKNNITSYSYSSTKNAVDYDIDNQKFLVRNYVERTSDMSEYSNEANRYEFLPFTYRNPDTPTNYNGGRPWQYETADVDHWYGMTMEFDFYMPKDGKMNSQDMIFNFSGDDDVWVFIDDILVLDLGGTHGNVDGSINFATGEIYAGINWNNVVKEDNNYSKTLYDAFNSATPLTEEEFNDLFANYTKHNLKFFYLERGASVSDCNIEFNMPVIPKGGIEVQKLFNGNTEGLDPNETYKFLISDEAGNGIANLEYDIFGIKGYTDESGFFYLKKDEIATFALENNINYFVKEVDPGSNSEIDSCTINNNNCENIDSTGIFSIDPDSMHKIIFTNKEKKTKLIISKTAVDSDENEIFKFNINIYDSINKENKIILTSENEKYSINSETGTISLKLKSGEDVTIPEIPVGAYIEIEEIDYDGYVPEINDGAITLGGNKYSYTATSDNQYIKNINYLNKPSYELPATGSSKSLILVLMGLTLTLIPFVYILFIDIKKGGLGGKPL